MLLQHFKYTHEDKEHNAKQNGGLRLFSDCLEGCAKCYNGTGHVLDIGEQLPHTCKVTREGGVFAVLVDRAGTNCVDSSNKLQAVEVQAVDSEGGGLKLVTVIRIFAIVIALCFFAVLLLILFRVRQNKARIDDAVHRALQDHEANRLKGSKLKCIGKEDIERAFPAKIATTEVQCAVCLQSVTGQMGRRLHCGHEFHADCILEWWTHRPCPAVECPLCRQKQEVHTEGDGSSEASDMASTVVESPIVESAIVEHTIVEI